MTNKEIVKWLQSLKLEIGRQNNQHLWNYEEALGVAIKVLQESRWISVSERLPETLDDMLVTDGETMAVGYYRPDARAWDSTSFAWLENRSEPPYGIKTVIAWMPLPESYREDYCRKPKQKTGKWKKTKYGYTWTENNVCLNFVDYYDAKENGEEE